MKIFIIILHVLIIILAGRNIHFGIYGYQLFILFYSTLNLMNILALKKNLIISTKIWAVVIFLIPGLLMFGGSLLKIIGRVIQSKEVGFDWFFGMIFGVTFITLSYFVFVKSKVLSISK